MSGVFSYIMSKSVKPKIRMCAIKISCASTYGYLYTYDYRSWCKAMCAGRDFWEFSENSQEKSNDNDS